MKNKMLKFLGMGVIMLFLLNLMVLAEKNLANENQIGEIQSIEAATIQASETSVKEKIKILKEGEKEIQTETKEKLQELKKSKEELRIQAKEQAKEVKIKIEQIREQYKTLKEDYKTAKENYYQEKEKIKESKEKANCKEETEDCKGKRIEHKKGLKMHLINTNAMIAKSLEKLFNQVETSAVLTDAETEEALTSLNEMKEKITAEQQKLEALAENATNEELKAGIKELKELWLEVKKEEKKMIVLMINSRLGSAVEKHQEYANALQMRIDNLEKQNIDVAALKELQQKFNERVEELNVDYAEAKKSWERSRDSQDEQVTKITKEAQDKIKEELKKTKSILREFLLKYKELKNKELKTP